MSPISPYSSSGFSSVSSASSYEPPKEGLAALLEEQEAFEGLQNDRQAILDAEAALLAEESDDEEDFEVLQEHQNMPATEEKTESEKVNG